MLLYSNKSVIRQLFQLNGSVVFGDIRQILMGVFLAGVTGFLQYLHEINSPYAPSIPNNYGLAALGMLVSFSIIFRTNLAWSRYWEALTQCHFMYSKWGDAFLQITVFCSTSLRDAEKGQGEDAAAKCMRLQVIYNNVVKYFSLLGAMAADRIYHGDTQRMDMRLQMGSWHDQVIRRQDLQNKDITNSKRLPDLRVGGSDHQQGLSMTPDLTPGKSSFALTQTNWQHTYYVVELPTDNEREALALSEDRVNLCLTWIVETLAMAAKDLITPPPIQSRMYQEISNGSLGFTNCVKISDTPFPFCYSQLVSVLLIVFCSFVPVFVCAFTQSFVAGPLLTFVIFHSIVCLNELAKILENPFGQDAEDICLEDFHRSFLQMMESTREALDVEHQGVIRGESRKELRQLTQKHIGGRRSMLRTVHSLIPEIEEKEEKDSNDTQSSFERSTNPKQSVYGASVTPTDDSKVTTSAQSVANVAPTEGSESTSSAQGAPGSISVTGVWCELPQQTLQQGEEKQQDGLLQQSRSNSSNGVGAARHGPLPTSGNYSLLSGVGCWRGLLRPDREAGQGNELPFRDIVDGSSKPNSATWVPQRNEPSNTTLGRNAGITAQDTGGTEHGIRVANAGSPPGRGGNEPALSSNTLGLDSVV
mmetsp:Transcript_113619/g.226101  ORF Transcript_113619/g.226101 Transcript_113619/m.226101 type:complete len:645 (-) Transcript_113619:69-2003(-)